MAPRRFARVRRFQRALALAGRPAARSWGALALAAGYFDQSHLIREFVELSGFSPERLAERATVPVKENHVALG
jgi:AraC-like DNA-binding protein